MKVDDWAAQHMVSLKCGFLKKLFIINDFSRNPHFNYQFQILNFCNFFQAIRLFLNENSNNKINFRKFRDSALRIHETMWWAAQCTWFSFLDILTDFLVITKLGSISNIDIYFDNIFRLSPEHIFQCNLF